MLLNPRYGNVGMIAFPYFFFIEVFGPIIDGLGYLTFVVAVGIALSFAAVGLEELCVRRYPRARDLLRLLGCPSPRTSGTANSPPTGGSEG